LPYNKIRIRIITSSNIIVNYLKTKITVFPTLPFPLFKNQESTVYIMPVVAAAAAAAAALQAGGAANPNPPTLTPFQHRRRAPMPQQSLTRQERALTSHRNAAYQWSTDVRGTNLPSFLDKVKEGIC